MNTAPNSNNRDISEEIERKRTHFEQNWELPSATKIEQCLAEVSQKDRPELLRELLYVEFEFAQRKANNLTLEHYLARFPEYESIIREVAEAVGQYTVFSNRSIAGYTLLGELGRGGMGVVYKAKSDLLNNYVAFKMISKRMVGNLEMLRRFTRELEMIGRLKHPNIVEAKHAGVDPNGSPYLVMELVEGVTLSQWGKQNPLPVSASAKETESTIISGASSSSNVSKTKKTLEKQLDSTRIA
jgi:serine/threonine protein kinase